MRGSETYNRLLELSGPSTIAQLFYAGVVLVVVAALLLSLGRLRWLGRLLGILGVITFMLALFLIHEQQIKEVKDTQVTVTRWRYSAPVRFQVRVALLGLPAAAAFLMMQILWKTQRRQRSRVPSNLKQGRLRFIRGDFDGALAIFDEAIRVSPYLGEAHHQRAIVHEAQGRLDEALVDLDQALQADPQYAPAYLMRGRLLTQKGELEAASGDLERFLTMRPSDVEGYLHRGLCRAKEGRDAEAVADLQRVMKLTNHSDYADPAKAQLDLLYRRLPDAEETEALSLPDATVVSVFENSSRYLEQPALSDQSQPANDRPSTSPAAPPASPTDTLPPK